MLKKSFYNFQILKFYFFKKEKKVNIVQDHEIHVPARPKLAPTPKKLLEKDSITLEEKLEQIEAARKNIKPTHPGFKKISSANVKIIH